MRKKEKISIEEVKYSLSLQGVEVRPKYCHDDYLYTSFTMPYPLKSKLDRIQKRFKVSRSKAFQLMMEAVDERNFFSSINKMKR